jgi:phage/plasmid-like protein (TIGR03299 family)
MFDVDKRYLYKDLDSPSGATYDEIIESLGLGFTAEKRPLLVEHNAAYFQVPDKVAIWHKENDAYLATVGNNYGLVQYRIAFSLADTLLSEGIEVVRGGPVNRGESAVLVLQAPGVLDLGNGNEIVNEVVLRSTHDGTGRIEVRTTPRNINTGVVLTTDALRPLSFKHSKRALERVADAKKTIHRIGREWEAFTQAAKSLMSVPLNQAEARGFIASLVEGKASEEGEIGVRCQKLRDEIYERWVQGVSSKLPACRGTLFGLVMAVGEWCDFHKTVKKSKRFNNNAAELNARLLGDAAKKKAKAWSMALALRKRVKVRV